MIKTGIDIVKISRIKEKINDQIFLSRTFNDKELKNSIDSLAGIFALKEAFFKATQIKIKKWNELVVKKQKNGKPYIVFDKNLIDFKIKSIDCSIAHDSEYAIANVVINEI
ncbi:holo-ACP synthase [archaeon]|jgi:phosphopantetheine--protein transferase-like protein|nr:holo-ACP synthase [archaeon]MBT4022348.1 holo-ACP synthase [archaeon]MBT4273226.1 holo-ACP synthase [archaeon]MBT4461331.1 holo-ACP synthase [archaeon]MBT4858990.1 holo-ACP synthase [archaeon]